MASAAPTRASDLSEFDVAPGKLPELGRASMGRHRSSTTGPTRREETATGHDLQLDLEAARQTVPSRVSGWVFRAGIDADIAVSVVTGDVADQLARESGDAILVVIGAPDSLHHSALPADLAYACLCPVAVVGTFRDVTYVDVAVHPSTEGASHART